MCNWTQGSSKTYICNNRDCESYMREIGPYYAQLSVAINEIAANASLKPPHHFFVAPGSVCGQVQVPNNLSTIIVESMPLDNTLHDVYPLLEGFSVLKDGDDQNVSLEGLRVGILSVSLDTRISIAVVNVNVTSYMSIEAGANSSVAFDGGCITTSTWISLKQRSSVYFRNSILSTVEIEAWGHAMVFMVDNVVSKQSSIFLRPNSDITAKGNTFLQGMRLTAHNSTILVTNNRFQAPEKPLALSQSFLPNFLLEVRCSVWFWIDENVFYNGTFQISDNSKVVGTSAQDTVPWSELSSSDLDYEDERPPSGAPKYDPCSLHIKFGSCLKFNRFVAEERKFRVYDLLTKPAEPRLVFHKGLDLGPLRATEDMGVILDATQNWWGDPSGPFLCCNGNGRGSYTSLFVNVSDWCGNMMCTNYSKVALPTTCLRSGCKQQLSKAEIIIFIVSGLSALLLLSASVTFSIYHNVRYFSVASFERYSRDYLLPKAHVQWRFGLCCSSIGALLTIANIAVPLISTSHTPAHAHQRILPFRGYAILWIYVVLALAQLVLTVVGVIVSFTAPRRIGSFIKPIYLWTLLNVIITIVITLDWLPSGGFVDLLAHFFITETSSILNLLYLCSALLCLVSVAAFIPVRLMNQLLNHSDHARISAVLEVAFLKRLMQSPGLEVKAKYLRISTATSIICGAFPTICVMYDLTIDTYFRTRLCISMAQHAIGMSSLAAIFVASFYYNKRLLLTLLSLILATVTVGSIQDVIFWSFYLSVAVDSIYTNGYVIFQIVSAIIWICSLLSIHWLIHLLNNSVSSELPKMAIENLNRLMDANITDNTHSAEKTPLLISESDSSRNSTIQYESDIPIATYGYFSS